MRGWQTRTPRSRSTRNPCRPCCRAASPGSAKAILTARWRHQPGHRARSQEPECVCLARRVENRPEAVDRRGCGFQPGYQPAAGLCPRLCRARSDLCRDLSTRSGHERPQHRDLDECELAQRLLLAWPGLSPQGRHRARHRGFFTRDRADAAARSRLLFRAGTAVQLQGRLRARLRISTRCCRWPRTTRPRSSRSSRPSPCRPSLQRCMVGRPRLRHPGRLPPHRRRWRRKQRFRRRQYRKARSRRPRRH